MACISQHVAIFCGFDLHIDIHSHRLAAADARVYSQRLAHKRDKRLEVTSRFFSLYSDFTFSQSDARARVLEVHALAFAYDCLSALALVCASFDMLCAL